MAPSRTLAPSFSGSRSFLISAPTTTPSMSRMCFAKSSFRTLCVGLLLSGPSSTWRSSILAMVDPTGVCIDRRALSMAP